MAITGEGFEIPIGVEDKATKTFNRIIKAGERVKKNMASVGKAVIVLNQGIELAGRAAAFLAKNLDVTQTQFAAFETSLIAVGKTANISDAALESLGDSFQEMSERIPKTATELADVAKVAGQLGVTGGDNILRFTETMAKLESASDLAGESGASAIARILNITEGGVENVDRFGASIVALGNNFAATEAEIAHMATEVARSTSQFNLNSADVLGLSTAMKQLGIQAQLGGSVVGKAMREISGALRNGGDELKSLEKVIGESGASLRDEFGRDANSVFVKYIEGLSRIEKAGGSVAGAMEGINLKGDEVNKVLPVLTKRTDQLARALGIANKGYEENIALNEEAEKAFKSLTSEAILFWNVIRNLAVDLVGSFAPVLKEIIIDMREGLISAITNLKARIEELKNIWSAFNTVISRVDWAALASDLKMFGAALFVAFSPLIGPAIVTGLSAIIPLLGTIAGFAVPLALVAAKWIAIAAAVVAVVAALEFVVNNLNKFDDLISGIGGGFVIMWEGVKRGIKGVALAMLLVIEDVTSTVAGTMFDVGGVAEKALNAVRAGQIALGNSIDDSNESIDEQKRLLGELGDSITSDLDFGFIGTVIGEGKKFLEGFNEELDKTEGLAKKAGAALDHGIGDPNKAGFVGPVMPAGGEEGVKKAEKTAKFEVLFNEDQLNQIHVAFDKLGEVIGKSGGGMGDAASGIAGAASSMLAMPMMFMQVADMFLDAILKILDFIPQMVNKIADVFQNITDLPTKILDAFKNLFSAVGDFVKNLIPNLLKDGVGLIKEAINFLAETLPDAFMSLVDTVPAIIEGLIAEVPEFAKKLAMGLIRMGPTLGIKMSIGFLKALPKITLELTKTGPIIAMAMAEGFIEAMKEAVNEIANMLGMDDIFNLPDIEEKMDAIGEKVSRSTSQMFEVADLQAQQRGVDMADKIRTGIMSATNRAADILTKLWNALKSAWEWISDTIVMPLINLFRKAWEFGVSTITMTIEALKAIWKWVDENITKPLMEGLMKVFKWFFDTVVSPIAGLIRSGFDTVVSFFTKLPETIKNAFSFITEFFSGDIAENIKEAFSAPLRFLTDFSFPGISMPGWLDDFIDAIDDLTSFGGFSMGGLVSATKSVGKKASDSYKRSDLGKATTAIGKSVSFRAEGGPIGGEVKNGVLYAAGGSLAQGTDTVPAMLTPGEFVINREATKKNLGLLSFINDSKSAVAPVRGDTSISVVVNAKTDLSASQIRREVIPELERQLKRKSQEGKFVLSGRGIRN